MNVSIVTTWGTACGISEYGQMLVQAAQAADSELRFTPVTDLHPEAVLHAAEQPTVVVLNFHAALHSQWQPEHIRVMQSRGISVIITYHDTGVPNSDQCKALHAVADRFIVHEPCEDLPGAVYLRQGVPGLRGGYQWRGHPDFEFAFWGQPILGTVGFPFPWKNYALLAEATAEAGWALLLLAPGANESQITTWTALNPNTLVVPDFIPAEAVVAYLAGCDATAFLYSCANTGTSGAIRQGLAARKPVLATAGCRQFRDLQLDEVGQAAIRWVTDLSPGGVAAQLAQLPIGRVDPGIVWLATQDSWRGLGARYAEIIREVAGAR